MTATLQIKTPPWAVPLLEPSRYKAIHGGRGSGKSHFFAELMIEAHVMNPNTKSLCVREFQSSLSHSVKSLLEEKIETLGLGSYFVVQQNRIKNRHGKGSIEFLGMSTQTEDSVKSYQGFDRAWVEEAQVLSKRSFELLDPTIRETGSEIWVSWNPRFETDFVDEFFRGGFIPPNAIVVEVNFWDNPWFPEVLREIMEFAKKRDYENYLHVWEGQYLTNSEARVLKNWRVEEFETPEDVFFRFGADWGFSIDPTVLVRCYIVGRKLYVDHEAVMVHCEITDTPDLFLTIPEAEKWTILADPSRPETISHLRKNGFPKIMEAKAGRGSIAEGIAFLQDFDIIIHPRCTTLIREATMFSYDKDRQTGEIKPSISKNNNVIDALRYACENYRRIKPKEAINFIPIPTLNFWQK